MAIRRPTLSERARAKKELGAGEQPPGGKRLLNPTGPFYGGFGCIGFTVWGIKSRADGVIHGEAIRPKAAREENLMVTALVKPLYTAEATATGGREGHVRSVDGYLDADLQPPVEMGGPGGATNPEELFAAGYAACFQSALGVVGRRAKVSVDGSTVAAKVTIGTTEGGGFGLSVALEVHIPDADGATTQSLIESAHEVCPYSNATRGNIEVALTAV
jgi:osmotically inducible protein OsmC